MEYRGPRIGLFPFMNYSVALARQTQVSAMAHFRCYAAALALLGESIRYKSIILLKRRIGYTLSS